MQEKKRTKSPTETVLMSEWGTERAVLLLFDEGSEVGAVPEVAAPLPLGTTVVAVVVEAAAAPDAALDGDETVEAVVGASCEVEAKVPLPDCACSITSSRSALAFEGIVDKKPIRGGSTEGCVKLP